MIDFSTLPAPQIIETLDFETILNRRKATFLAFFKDDKERAIWEDRLKFESEPVVKLLEENTYLEMLLRQRINESVKACLLPYAIGTDLDNLATFYNMQRQIIQHADPKANPPLQEIKESDERFRRRIQLSFNMLNTAGSANAYKAQALSVSPLVIDAYVNSPTGGAVDVVLLCEKSMTSDQLEKLRTHVETHLSADTIRPICDKVTVKLAKVKTFSIQAKLQLFYPTHQDLVEKQARKNLNDFLENARQFAFDITPSAIIKALFVDGVQNVELTKPADKIKVNDGEVAECTAITLTFAGKEEYD
ncbi:hypothetical protein A6A19_00890 [Actinobacillus delphinicola]|uniref:baseplate assembly protein n=1 Tax=Actinobacillus delphinicola TaxID=51161 RepID=UPI002441C5D1|nr:baseplate J/gp47 family protein [Actinobacillus delphinicola]MDG6896585.1 hypothetical protein [Actinobacillus delphinicola]